MFIGSIAMYSDARVRDRHTRVGRLVVYSGRAAVGLGWVTVPEENWFEYLQWENIQRPPIIWLGANMTVTGVWLTVPVWLMGAVLAAAVPWFLSKRVLRPGYCICGYNLTGNMSNICPECGRGL